MPFTPFNPAGDLYDHPRGRLPHWRQKGSTYFISTRLADSIPSGLHDEWLARRDTWLKAHGAATPDDLPETLRHEYHREFTATFHRLLDAGHGECVLARPDCAALLIARLLAGHGTAYRLDAWVVMPNHIHALVEPASIKRGSDLGAIIKSWKGGSAREINQLLGRSGTFWQAEPFDHIVRSEAQLAHYRRYIAENPAKAGLRSGFAVGDGAEYRSA
jgi:putative transposase